MRAALLMFLLCCAALAAMAQAVDRTKPPSTPPLPAFKLPPMFETRLPNGLSVVLIEDQRFPMVTVRLSFEAGSKFDPKDMPGLAETAGALLKEGTAARNSRQIAEELAAIGGSLNVQTSSDSNVLAANALSEHTADLLALAADVARNASFPEDEVKLRKRNRIQELLAERSQSETLAEETYRKVVFGGHPYGVMLPTEESIGRISRDALTAFRDKYMTPNNAVLIVLGALPPRKQMLETITAAFGDWQRRDLPPPVPATFPKAERSITLVDRPGSVQADIRAGRLAVSRTSPDYFPLLVANSILGAGGSSRMFLNIRESKGYAYDAHSSLAPRKDAGLFEAVTQVRNEVIEPAMEAVLAEMKEMAVRAPADEELERVKNYMSGIFVIGLESQGGLANQVTMVKSMGLPNDYLEKYVERVRAVQAAQIQAAAGKYISPENASIVVVGDAEKIAKPLEKFGKVKVEKAQ